MRYWRAITLCASTAMASASCAPASPPPQGADAGELQEHREDSNERFWSGKGPGSVHAAITRDALPFLIPAVLDAIVAANDGTDSTGKLENGADYDFQHDGDYHFDQCRTTRSLVHVEAEYQAAVDAFGDPNRRTWARTHFGRNLHTTQDFYAHSNWVDANQQDIVTRDSIAWPAVNPNEGLAGMIVLGKDLPAGATIMRESGSRVPIVTLANGGQVRGLMTAGNTASEDCPSQPGIAIVHGATVATSQNGWFKALRTVINIVTVGLYWVSMNHPDYDSVMNKDLPGQWFYEEARALAVTQTKEEFCRLVRRVDLRFGDGVAEELLTSWVGAPGSANRTQYAAACPNVNGPVVSLFMVPGY